MGKIQDLINLIEITPFFYETLWKDCIKDLSDKQRSLNIIIGVRGRQNFIPSCISHLKRSIGNEPITITLVEQDASASHQSLCKDLGIDYIFVSNDRVTYGEKYNRSLCFNIGFLFTKESPWYLFHDVDMLVASDFITNLKKYIEKNPMWLQPYTKKRVLRLTDIATQNILTARGDLNNLSLGVDFVESAPGSTGGSILVRRDAFIEVGGFDPELFYGYSPEDSFFWSKLETIGKRVDHMEYHFAGGGMFADDPPIEIFHMYHPPTHDSNPDLHFMHFLRECFWHSPYEEKLRYTKYKKELLEEDIQKLRKEVNMPANDFWQDQYVVELRHHTNQNLTIAHDFLNVVRGRPSFTEILKDARSLLEVGCGTGDMCEAFRSTYNLSSILGIDLAQNAVTVAKDRFPEVSFAQFDILNQDVSTLGKFDIIISSNTLEHFFDPYPIINNLLQFCKCFIIIVPYNQPPDICDVDGGGGHVTSFNDSSFEKYTILDKFLFRTEGWVHSSKGEVPQQLVLFLKGVL